MSGGWGPLLVLPEFYKKQNRTKQNPLCAPQALHTAEAPFHPGDPAFTMFTELRVLGSERPLFLSEVPSRSPDSVPMTSLDCALTACGKEVGGFGSCPSCRVRRHCMSFMSGGLVSGAHQFTLSLPARSSSPELEPLCWCQASPPSPSNHKQLSPLILVSQCN